MSKLSDKVARWTPVQRIAAAVVAVLLIAGVVGYVVWANVTARDRECQRLYDTRHESTDPTRWADLRECAEEGRIPGGTDPSDPDYYTK